VECQPCQGDVGCVGLHCLSDLLECFFFESQLNMLYSGYSTLLWPAVIWIVLIHGVNCSGSIYEYTHCVIFCLEMDRRVDLFIAV